VLFSKGRFKNISQYNWRTYIF